MFSNLLTMLSPCCVVKHTGGKKYMVIKDQKNDNSKVPTTLFKIRIFGRAFSFFFFYFPDIELSILDSLLYFSQQTYDKNVT